MKARGSGMKRPTGSAMRMGKTPETTKSDGQFQIGSSQTAERPAIKPPVGTAAQIQLGIEALSFFGAYSAPSANAAGPMLPRPMPASTRSAMSQGTLVAKAVRNEN